jgi:ferredoxin
MAYQVTVMPSGHKFEVATDETILGAALRHSIGLPYGCKNGACGSCKGRVLEGTIHQGDHAAAALTAQEKRKAARCSAAPTPLPTSRSNAARCMAPAIFRSRRCRAA